MAAIYHPPRYVREQATRDYSTYQDTDESNLSSDYHNWTEFTQQRQTWLYGKPRIDVADIAAWDRLCNLGRAA